LYSAASVKLFFGGWTPSRCLAAGFQCGKSAALPAQLLLFLFLLLFPSGYVPLGADFLHSIFGMAAKRLSPSACLFVLSDWMLAVGFHSG
jgi:hypothetical protein